MSIIDNTPNLNKPEQPALFDVPAEEVAHPDIIPVEQGGKRPIEGAPTIRQNIPAIPDAVHVVDGQPQAAVAAQPPAAPARHEAQPQRNSRKGLYAAGGAVGAVALATGLFLGLSKHGSAHEEAEQAPTNPAGTSAPVTPGTQSQSPETSTNTATTNPSMEPTTSQPATSTETTPAESDKLHPVQAPDGRYYHYNHNFPVTGGYNSYQPALWKYTGEPDQYPPNLLQETNAKALYKDLVQDFKCTESISTRDSTLALCYEYLLGGSFDEVHNEASQSLQTGADELFSYRYRDDTSYEPGTQYELLNSSYSPDKAVLVVKMQSVNADDSSPVTTRYTLTPAPASLLEKAGMGDNPTHIPTFVISSIENLAAGDTSLGD